ncbi:hypothetical protein RDI58_002324 [Solanum bulbocastanum]|uniref:Uncharacterized protein n=1 Tax=Solanum bulbocastanum TaxID=147425 RepID=A0AAN8YQR9_SOLBU
MHIRIAALSKCCPMVIASGRKPGGDPGRGKGKRNSFGPVGIYSRWFNDHKSTISAVAVHVKIFSVTSSRLLLPADQNKMRSGP